MRDDRSQYSARWNSICRADSYLMAAAIDVERLGGGDKRRLTKADRELIADIKAIRERVQARRDDIRETEGIHA